ncbi:MAG: tRNA pseudouridine(55) synthase TruB [Oscillospiraceae bacterium]
MNGIILINKPNGFTSFDVVAKMRGILRTKSIGHAGTLDPMATGVLPIFVGRATKCCDILPNQNKTYIADFRLGITTDTQDITGSVLSQKPVNITKEQFYEVIESFRGDIKQIPPMYSAVKVGGKKLYELARKGIEIEREARDITIHSLKILKEDFDNNEFQIEVACSKGTYIRSLCNDIGDMLGCGGVLTKLSRTVAGDFSIEDCLTLEQVSSFAENEKTEEILIPVEKAFVSLRKTVLDKRQSQGFINGVKYSLDNISQSLEPNEKTAVYSYDGEFLGIGLADSEDNILRICKLFKISNQ